MSSIPNNSNYGEMIDALKRGDRIVYQKKTGQFLYLQRKIIKHLPKGEYITNLSEVKERILSYVKENGINDTQREALDGAFKARGESVESRLKSRKFILYGKAKWKRAIDPLKTEIPRAIDAAAQVARTSLPQKTVQKVTAQPDQPLQEKELPQPQTQLQSAPPSEQPVGDAPPPPVSMAPPPPPGGLPPPPPPPPGLMKPKKSTAHRAVTENVKDLKLFKGEPKLPTIREEDDLGKLNKISPDQKTKYAKAIDEYLYGTPNKVMKAKGRTQIEVVERKENGLVHTLARIKTFVDEYTGLEEPLAGSRVKKAQTEQGKIQKKRLLKKLTGLQKSRQPVTLYKKTKEGMIPISFYPKAELEKARKQFDGLSPSDKTRLEKEGLNPHHLKSLEWKIQSLTDQISQLDTEMSEIDQEIGRLEGRKKSIEAMTDHGIPFQEWPGLLTKKTAMKESWARILGGLSKKKAAKEEKKPPKKLQMTLDILSQPGFEAMTQLMDLKKQLDMPTLTSLAADPDRFYADTVDLDGTG